MSTTFSRRSWRYSTSVTSSSSVESPVTRRSACAVLAIELRRRRRRPSPGHRCAGPGRRNCRTASPGSSRPRWRARVRPRRWRPWSKRRRAPRCRRSPPVVVESVISVNPSSVVWAWVCVYVLCMASEHYFSVNPGSELNPRTIRARLAGRDVELTTSGGVFSPERIDTGTQVLLVERARPASRREPARPRLRLGSDRPHARARVTSCDGVGRRRERARTRSGAGERRETRHQSISTR